LHVFDKHERSNYGSQNDRSQRKITVPRMTTNTAAFFEGGQGRLAV
jgi:hypothetical protein